MTSNGTHNIVLLLDKLALNWHLTLVSLAIVVCMLALRSFGDVLVDLALDLHRVLSRNIDSLHITTSLVTLIDHTIQIVIGSRRCLP